MPLFDVTKQGPVPFRQVLPGAELCGSEIEDLIWSDLEAFLGETLFPIARQARLAGGGRVDVLALDESDRVVVIEIKRDVDRTQLAQCLEYAGWARAANLAELAALYHGGRRRSSPTGRTSPTPTRRLWSTAHRASFSWRARSKTGPVQRWTSSFVSSS